MLNRKVGVVFPWDIQKGYQLISQRWRYRTPHCTILPIGQLKGYNYLGYQHKPEQNFDQE